jgi:glycosyltransferase involved in cell wall biosynthesis
MVHLVDRCVARWATDRVISVSSEMTDVLSGQYPRAKIATIPNGIDLESVRSKFSKSEARMRLGIPEEFIVMGTAGRLEPVKRLDLFLEMARRVRDRRSDVRFVVAGEGREESRLRALAVSLGIQNEMMFLGHRDDVFDVLRAFDIMVLCSDHEGLPMVLLEAMALGALVVARAVGGIPEVIEQGVSGVLVNSSDPAALAESCLNAVDDTERSSRMAEAAQTLVRDKFSAERTAGEVRLLYNSLVDRS